MAKRHHRPDCLSCVHFKVSWDANYPRACHKFGFKGKELPSYTVYQTTGQECPFYERAPSLARKTSTSNTQKKL